MKTSIAIVDYGMGNLRSVAQALRKAAPEADVAIVDKPEAIRAADRVVLPGQGAMPDCMRQLAASGAREAVIEAAGAKPFLGICIGLQMLFERIRDPPQVNHQLIGQRRSLRRHPRFTAQHQQCRRADQQHSSRHEQLKARQRHVYHPGWYPDHGHLFTSLLDLLFFFFWLLCVRTQLNCHPERSEGSASLLTLPSGRPYTKIL